MVDKLKLTGVKVVKARAEECDAITGALLTAIAS